MSSPLTSELHRRAKKRRAKHRRRHASTILIPHAIRHFLMMVIFGFFGVFGTIFIAGLAILWYLNSTLPDYSTLVKRNVPESSKIYSRDGTLLYEFFDEVKRTRVSLAQISVDLQHATVAVEDKDFYNHGAISVTGIARAVNTNYRTGNFSQGGSTISQQFVKNALLNREKTFGRKVKEVLLAYRIESHLSKDEILNLYLNEIPYGRNAYGAEAAAESYFGKSAKDLTLAESAYLAALPQAPSYLSPTGANAKALDERKNLVLSLMKDQGYIDQQKYEAAKLEKVTFRDLRTSIVAPHFVTWIQNYLTEKYGKEILEEGGLKVYTTLDLKLQRLAEDVVKDGAGINEKKYRAANAALVAVEPSTGKLLAMAGGKDYFADPEPAGCIPGDNCVFTPNFNAAVSMRQPGSSFKPYVYVTAFGSKFGMTPASTVVDEPTTFAQGSAKPYAPKNYDGSYHGKITLRKALAGSLNIPAVKTLAAVGVDNAIDVAKGLGITTPLENCGLSLVLGGCEVKLVDHVAAFAAFANSGKASGLQPFLRIEDKHGNILTEYHEQNKQVVEPEAAYELVSIMTDNDARTYIFGKNSPLTIPNRPVAAKTGTTNNWRDGWTIGFTPQLAAGVWAGNDDGSLMAQNADGVFVAAPMWNRFMTEALAKDAAVDFPVPAGMVQAKVDGAGRVVNKNVKNAGTAYFPYYALPKEFKTIATPKVVLAKSVRLPKMPGAHAPGQAN